LQLFLALVNPRVSIRAVSHHGRFRREDVDEVEACSRVESEFFCNVDDARGDVGVVDAYGDVFHGVGKPWDGFRGGKLADRFNVFTAALELEPAFPGVNCMLCGRRS
jgi:hypothetical protein